MLFCHLTDFRNLGNNNAEDKVLKVLIGKQEERL